MKRRIAALALAALLVLGLTACGGSGGSNDSGNAGTDGNDSGSSGEAVTIKVGASPAPHAAILEVAKEILAGEGYNLDIVEFDDYVLPNESLEDGSLDANYFQHITYMNEFNESNGTHLVSAAGIHYEPFCLYAGKSSAEELETAQGAQIAVPNDATNEARALMLLEQEGLITLKEGAGLSATKSDIAENPYNFDIVEMEARLLTTTLQDVDFAVINGNYAIDAGLKISDAIAVEASTGAAAEAYVNVLAVKEGNESSESIQALVKALQSEQVKTYIEETYDGAVVPLF